MFKRVICVSLLRRPDRWGAFIDQLPDDWPFGEVEYFPAIDGQKCPAPSWWNSGDGAWGCYQSHLTILADCLNRGIESCLFFEDDAILCDDFTPQVNQFLQELPDDWSMLYLGGEHYYPDDHPPVRVSPHVYIPYNLNRTHAFAIRGQSAMRAIYQHLNEIQNQYSVHHVDWWLGKLHEQRQWPIYCPSKWLIGQNEGRSNISHTLNDVHFFPSAIDCQPVPNPVVVVMGNPHGPVKNIVPLLEQLDLQVSHPFIDHFESDDRQHPAVQLNTICESGLPYLKACHRGLGREAAVRAG